MITRAEAIEAAQEARALADLIAAAQEPGAILSEGSVTVAAGMIERRISLVMGCLEESAA